VCVCACAFVCMCACVRERHTERERVCACAFAYVCVFWLSSTSCVARGTGLEVLKRIPLAAADNAKHLQLLSWFVNKVQLMQPGHMLILPGGWVVRAPPKVREGRNPRSARESSVSTPPVVELVHSAALPGSTERLASSRRCTGGSMPAPRSARVSRGR
jgi:hypothetical protein